MLALARIRQYGDAVLRMKAREVEEVDDDVRRLAERMTALMHEAQGVGLAATQVGVLRRIFVFVGRGRGPRARQPGDHEALRARLERRRRGLPLAARRARARGARCAVTIEGLDADGEPVAFELELPSSRIVQHELDHLDGVLIIDRTDDESRRAALGEAPAAARSRRALTWHGSRSPRQRRSAPTSSSASPRRTRSARC